MLYMLVRVYGTMHGDCLSKIPRYVGEIGKFLEVLEILFCSTQYPPSLFVTVVITDGYVSDDCLRLFFSFTAFTENYYEHNLQLHSS